MRPIPDITNITAAGTTQPDYAEALYAHFASSSTKWTPTLEYRITGPPRPGSYAWTIRSNSDDFEINYKNTGTQAAPSADDARWGINPDGSSAPIADSRDPSASAPNYSGRNGFSYQNGPIATRFSLVSGVGTRPGPRPGNAEFILAEWPDAIMVLWKDAARTYFPRGVHAGKILVPGYEGLRTSPVPPSFAADGLAILGGAPGLVGPLGVDGNYVWINANTNNPLPDVDQQSIWRGCKGQICRAATNVGLPNGTPSWVWQSYHRTESTTYATWPNSLRVNGWLVPSFVDACWGVYLRWALYKYIRILPDKPPMYLWSNGLETPYMCLGLGYAGPAPAGNHFLNVPIPDGFTVNP